MDNLSKIPLGVEQHVPSCARWAVTLFLICFLPETDVMCILLIFPHLCTTEEIPANCVTMITTPRVAGCRRMQWLRQALQGTPSPSARWTLQPSILPISSVILLHTVPSGNEHEVCAPHLWPWGAGGKAGREALARTGFSPCPLLQYSCTPIAPCGMHSPPAASLASVRFLNKSQNYFAGLPAFFLRNSSEKECLQGGGFFYFSFFFFPNLLQTELLFQREK